MDKEWESRPVLPDLGTSPDVPDPSRIPHCGSADWFIFFGVTQNSLIGRRPCLCLRGLVYLHYTYLHVKYTYIHISCTSWGQLVSEVYI